MTVLKKVILRIEKKVMKKWDSGGEAEVEREVKAKIIRQAREVERMKDIGGDIILRYHPLVLIIAKDIPPDQVVRKKTNKSQMNKS